MSQSLKDCYSSLPKNVLDCSLRVYNNKHIKIVEIFLFGWLNVWTMEENGYIN